MLQCGLFRSNLALPIVAISYDRGKRSAGAGDGNRTHVASLEGWSSTIELHPPGFCLPSVRKRVPPGTGGGGRIRTYVDIRQQIYSLPPLTTRPPLHVIAKQAFRALSVLPNLGRAGKTCNI